jgi:hypothetical protein
MEAIRFDIVPLPTGWLLTESSRHLSTHVSSFSAVEEAKRQADLRPEAPAVIFLWQQGKEQKVYDTRQPPEKSGIEERGR